MTHPIKERTEMKKLEDEEGREGVQKRVDRNVMMNVDDGSRDAKQMLCRMWCRRVRQSKGAADKRSTV